MGPATASLARAGLAKGARHHGPPEGSCQYVEVSLWRIFQAPSAVRRRELPGKGPSLAAVNIPRSGASHLKIVVRTSISEGALERKTSALERKTSALESETSALESETCAAENQSVAKRRTETNLHAPW